MIDEAQATASMVPRRRRPPFTRPGVADTAAEAARRVEVRDERATERARDGDAVHAIFALWGIGDDVGSDGSDSRDGATAPVAVPRATGK